jgi:hypothetical protein
MLDESGVVDRAKQLLEWRKAECRTLDKVYAYLRGKQPLPVVPRGAPTELRRLAQMSRVNMIPLAIGVPAQSLYVSGYRSGDGGDNAEAWAAWQANKMDARQTGIHRATLAYGVSYVRVTPGDPHPVIKGVSPRNMTAAYGEDDDWPRFGLERLRTREPLWRLYDDEAVYSLTSDQDGAFKFTGAAKHDMGVCPVVRYRNIDDLDDEQVGEVEPLMALQDQIDFTTFGLLVAQHFQAFRQRYIIGWTTDDEDAKVKASASRFLTFEDDDVKVGEFAQADLGGYLDSRTASVENLATISQTPPQHLLGKLVNLAAEALVAAESGQRRKIGERETLFGESHEQVFWLVDRAAGRTPDESAQVRWADTEARSFAATVDGLGKLAQMLGVPPQALWERVPGVTQQDVEEWKRVASEGNAIDALNRLLDEQAAPAA